MDPPLTSFCSTKQGGGASNKTCFYYNNKTCFYYSNKTCVYYSNKTCVYYKTPALVVTIINHAKGKLPLYLGFRVAVNKLCQHPPTNAIWKRCSKVHTGAPFYTRGIKSNSSPVAQPQPNTSIPSQTLSKSPSPPTKAMRNCMCKCVGFFSHNSECWARKNAQTINTRKNEPARRRLYEPQDFVITYRSRSIEDSAIIGTILLSYPPPCREAPVECL